MNSIRIWASRIFLLASGFGAVPQIPGTGRDMFRNIGSIALLTWMMAVIGLLKYDRSKLRWWDYLMVASMAAFLIYSIAAALVGSTSQIAVPASAQPMVHYDVGYGIGIDIPSDWVVEEATERTRSHDSLAELLGLDLDAFIWDRDGSPFLFIAHSADETTWRLHLSAVISEPTSPRALEGLSPRESAAFGSGMCKTLEAAMDKLAASLLECQWEYVEVANRTVLITEHRQTFGDASTSRNWAVKYPVRQAFVTLILDASPYSLTDAHNVAQRIWSSVVLPDP